MSQLRPIHRWALLAQAAYAIHSESNDALRAAVSAAGMSLCSIALRGPFAAYSASDGSSYALVVRGTENVREALADCDAAPIRWDMCDAEELSVDVHSGFGEAAEDLNDWMERELYGERRNVVLIGHSLGGAVATLLATHARPDVASLSLFTYGSPRVGDKEFARRFAAWSGVASVRVVHDVDLVPRLPPEPMGYRHVGGLVQLSRSGETTEPVTPPPGPWHELIDALEGQALADHHIDTYVAACQAYATAIPA